MDYNAADINIKMTVKRAREVLRRKLKFGDREQIKALAVLEEYEQRCRRCNGQGTVGKYDADCPECGGTGKRDA
jgi:RecJ-like exonuclease